MGNYINLEPFIGLFVNNYIAINCIDGYTDLLVY
jgi:hypothetical protein